MNSYLQFRQGSFLYNFYNEDLPIADVNLVTSNASKEHILPQGDTWSIHKFGGTCVGTYERIQNVAKIIVEDQSLRKVAVVSAMSKVTDMMYDLLNKAQARDESYNAALDKLYEKHRDTASALLEGEELSSFLNVLEKDVHNLRAMLRAICIGMCQDTLKVYLLDACGMFWKRLLPF